MRHTYSKAEKLKSKKLIDSLFVEGKSVKAFPLRLVYLESDLVVGNVQAGVSVAKRNFKLAVSRNRIKRLMRESYRLHKHLIDTEGTTFALLFIYTGHKEIYTGHKEVSQEELHKAMVKILKRFNDAISSSSS